MNSYQKLSINTHQNDTPNIINTYVTINFQHQILTETRLKQCTKRF